MINNENLTSVRRALLSVSNKAGLIEFAQGLHELGVEIVSTGGTSAELKKAAIPHKQVDELTGLPAMFDGRVKTLHPKIHAGILSKRDKHADEMTQHQMDWIDLVVVNFYPFAEAIKQPNLTFEQAVEYIDIGGPTMVRAAAKNFAWVGVAIDPTDYTQILTELRAKQGLSFGLKQHLAEKVFALTARYDAMIHAYFAQHHEQSECPLHLNLQLEKMTELRYGENPHQKASAYQWAQEKTGVLSAHQHQGKALSYNNILDAEAALTCVSEFIDPACVIVKHANPCGVASAKTISEAYQHAYAADSLSAFGGIVALNRPCTEEIAKAITAIFMEVVIAPAFTPEALTVLAAKPNLRVLQLPEMGAPNWEMKFITGGVLLQEKDKQALHAEDLKIVTHIHPTSDDINTMLFAWRVLKHIKSNGILLAKGHATIGIGAGQVSRVDSVDLAIRKAGEQINGSVLASDAFFPFRDSIDRLANTGVRAIIQPGGSMRDDEVIAACNEHGIAMVFTSKRCFRH